MNLNVTIYPKDPGKIALKYMNEAHVLGNFSIFLSFNIITNIPVVNLPGILNALSLEFKPLFDMRQLMQFGRYIISEKASPI